MVLPHSLSGVESEDEVAFRGMSVELEFCGEGGAREPTELATRGWEVEGEDVGAGVNRDDIGVVEGGVAADRAGITWLRAQ